MKKKVVKKPVKRVPKTKPKSKWILALVVFSVLNLAYFLYQKFKPRPTDIFQIEASSLVYGDTTLVGYLQKDTTPDKVGLFLLSLPGGKIVILNQLGLDDLVGSKVEAVGTLFPPVSTEPPLMRLNSIKVTD